MNTNEIIIKKAKNLTDLRNQRFKTFAFEAEFKDSFGIPETNGTWLIWGDSGNGKTRFALQLAKYLCRFGKVFYNTLEERSRLSFRQALEDNHMEAVGSKFGFETEGYEELCARLSRKRSPKIVIIDSLQYFRITVNQYISLRNQFPKVLFVFISHAKGDLPKGAVADEIRYDADIKILVKSFTGQVRSRFGGNHPFTIWEKGVRNAALKLT
ncbi:ATP-binding protein [Pedobacter cryoconitis]|uniref:AAA+ ATPase domain-containing protein n=1 Tax=Pedobacter cryoconitis TaxID=188932 RepID=A0A7X0MJ15_9SPHI|nr:ATP-binding protein [Pedobacter cryoconitis]MBB6499130.1 hypothetical protein [Pedobacter cryoconitis]